MTNGELLNRITEDAQAYRLDARASIARNKHMNTLRGHCLLSQDEIDALLVDFINFVGVQCGVDFGLYVKDFRGD